MSAQGSLRPSGTGPARGPQAVAGASVTSAVIRDSIIRSARAVLRVAAGAAEPAGQPRLDRETLRRASWPTLVDGRARCAGSLLHARRGRPPARERTIRSRTRPSSICGSRSRRRRRSARAWSASASTRPSSAKLGPEDDLVLIAASGPLFLQGNGVAPIRRVRAHRDRAGRAHDPPARRRPCPHRHPGRAPAARSCARSACFGSRGPAGSTPPRRSASTSRSRAITAEPGTATGRLARLPRTRPLPGPTSAAPPRPTDQRRGTNSPGARAASAPRAGRRGASVQAPLWQDIWWTRRFEIGGPAADAGRARRHPHLPERGGGARSPLSDASRSAISSPPSAFSDSSPMRNCRSSMS